MTRHVNIGLTVGDHLDAIGGKTVLDAPDRNLVARNDLGGEQHRIALLQLDLVVAVSNAGQRSKTTGVFANASITLG